MAFAAIGCSLGSGVNGEILELAVQWPLSLCGLVIVMGVILFTSSWILASLFGLSKETAILASSPGALSYSLAIAANGVGDARSIIVIQSFRLLSITTVLPLVLDLLNLEHGGGNAMSDPNITFVGTAGVYFLTLVVGFVMSKRNLPAAYLIGGVLVSGVLHFTGVVTGRPQSVFLAVGFLITGSVIGARFIRIPLVDVRRLLIASFVVVVVSTAIAALFAAMAAKVLGMPFGQLWVSYAPGGVEEMAAMALALGFDSVFVATHHLFRIFLLIFSLPIILRYLKRISGDLN